MILRLIAVMVLLLPPVAKAHDSRPLYIELRELQGGAYRLEWKTPPSVSRLAAPLVALPDRCQRQGNIAESSDSSGLVRRASFDCAGTAGGMTLSIDYPGANPSLSSLVRYLGAAGEEVTEVLDPEQGHWTVPESLTANGVAWSYTALGVEHILVGTDHLLFLLCLLWIAGSGYRILITVTGFTLAHSLTLVLSALDVVRLPIAPVEAVIALSIVFLASEIASGQRQSLTWRYPIGVSSTFGLLHGFGFANALYEVGLPQTELATALLFFNLGVEVGQLLFIGAVIALGLLCRTAVSRSASVAVLAAGGRRAELWAVYGIGILASFWLVERVAGFA